jgi:hypothetical protein
MAGEHQPGLKPHFLDFRFRAAEAARFTVRCGMESAGHGISVP